MHRMQGGTDSAEGLALCGFWNWSDTRSFAVLRSGPEDFVRFVFGPSCLSAACLVFRRHTTAKTLAAQTGYPSEP